jgi:hypothetical protein
VSPFEPFVGYILGIFPEVRLLDHKVMNTLIKFCQIDLHNGCISVCVCVCVCVCTRTHAGMFLEPEKKYYVPVVLENPQSVTGDHCLGQRK